MGRMLLVGVVLAWVSLLCGCTPPPASAQAGSLPEQPNADVGYPSPQAALDALRRKPGVNVSVVQNGYTIAEDDSEARPVMWAFPPNTDPAYPSAVRRSVFVRDNTVYIDQRVMCLADKLACDRLVISFNQLNDRIREHMRQQPGFVR